VSVKTGELFIRPWDKNVKIHCIHVSGDTYQIVIGAKILFSIKAVETSGLVKAAERKWREIYPQSSDPAFY
jgi:hypothetical protein